MLLLVLFLLPRQNAAVATRVALLMLMRDEEQLVRDHLDSWRPIAWCGVGAVDDRTNDNSANAFLAAMPRSFVFYYRFDGLGPARTLLITEAYFHFPEATHALFVDPDWMPKTIPTDALNTAPRDATVFVFRVSDRNGATERLLDWCFRLPASSANDELILPRFKYRWHEVLDIAAYIPHVLNGWEIQEIPNNKSYHATQHGHAASSKRYEFEIALLERDISFEYPDDPRLHYYLGVDYLALGDAKKEYAPREEIKQHYESSVGHLSRHVEVETASQKTFGGLARNEMTYVAMLQWAQALHRLEKDEEAFTILARAEIYDSARAEAPLQSARLSFAQRRFVHAFDSADRAANLPVPTRTFYHHPGAYACEATRLAVAAALNELNVQGECRPCSEPQHLLVAKKAERLLLRDDECFSTKQDVLDCFAHCQRRKSESKLPLASYSADHSRFPLHSCATTTTLPDVAKAVSVFRYDPVESVSRLQLASLNDPACCAPYREFSRLFLGEAPASSRLNESVRLSLESFLETSSWSRQSQVAYALASLRHLRNDTQGAKTALETLFPVQDKKNENTAEIHTKLAAKNHLTIATVANKETENLKNLRDSVSAASSTFSLVVLGLGAEYTGHETKLKFYFDWLHTVAPSALVLLVDAYDVLIWPSVENFVSRFESFHADVVFGADASPYPDLAIENFYEGGAPYLNSGTIAGTASSILTLFRAAIDLGPVTTCGPDDQRAFHNVYIQGVPGLVLDIDRDELLFHSLHRELRHLEIDADGQLRVGDQEKLPCVSHGNAGDGKAAYASVVRAWRKSRLDKSTTIVEPDLYMTGLELWRRGDTSKAQDIWEEYINSTSLECSEDHATAVRYNLGVLHDAQGNQESALRYYELALVCDPSHGDSLANTGVAWARLGKYETAASYLERAVFTNPTSSKYRNNLDVVLERIVS